MHGSSVSVGKQSNSSCCCGRGVKAVIGGVRNEGGTNENDLSIGGYVVRLIVTKKHVELDTERFGHVGTNESGEANTI